MFYITLVGQDGFINFTVIYSVCSIIRRNIDFETSSDDNCKMTSYFHYYSTKVFSGSKSNGQTRQRPVVTEDL